MKPYSLDDYWELIKIEHEAACGQLPWVDRTFYRMALAWLRWRLRKAVVHSSPLIRL